MSQLHCATVAAFPSLSMFAWTMKRVESSLRARAASSRLNCMISSFVTAKSAPYRAKSVRYTTSFWIPHITVDVLL